MRWTDDRISQPRSRQSEKLPNTEHSEVVMTGRKRQDKDLVIYEQSCVEGQSLESMKDEIAFELKVFGRPCPLSST